MTTTESPIEPGSVVQARAGLLTSPLSETELVMLDADHGAYFGLESVAKTIWDAIAEPLPVREVSALVHAHYEIDETTAETDTLEFLTALRAADLITVDGAGEPASG